MKQNRYLSFGYRIANGALTSEENEAEVVRQIYADYLSGLSYQSIAAKLSAGTVPYKAASAAWNKNMVKRILENPRYTVSVKSASVSKKVEKSETMHLVTERL